jgi:4-hydroxy-tetrahydrodipicolinate reductase
MQAVIFGRGAMSRGLADALARRGDEVVAVFGRPASLGGAQRPDPRSLGRIDVAFEMSHGSSVVENIQYAIEAGCRQIVIGTSGWADDRSRVAAILAEHDASAIHGPSFSIGVVLFQELAEAAARLFGRFEEYDPYILEWHRRNKPDRPSGTALAIAERVLPFLPSKRSARLAEDRGAPSPDTLEIVSLRAGATPGMHTLGFDAAGESIELRIEARDRAAYISGAMLAADRLVNGTPALPAGITRFETVVRETLGRPTGGATTDTTSNTSSSTTAESAPASALIAASTQSRRMEVSDVLA